MILVKNLFLSGGVFSFVFLQGLALVQLVVGLFTLLFWQSVQEQQLRVIDVVVEPPAHSPVDVAPHVVDLPGSLLHFGRGCPPLRQHDPPLKQFWCRAVSVEEQQQFKGFCVPHWLLPVNQTDIHGPRFLGKEGVSTYHVV